MSTGHFPIVTIAPRRGISGLQIGRLVLSEVRIESAEEQALQSVCLEEDIAWHSFSLLPEKFCQSIHSLSNVSTYKLVVTGQVDIASGSVRERKKFSQRVFPLRPRKRFLERAPKLYGRHR